MPLRVLLVDNHPIVRAGIRAELERIPGTELAGEANDGREALALLRSNLVHLVLMDIAMPGLNGLEATARISKEFPAVRVIILSRHDNEQYFWHALKAGAAGYLLKNAALSELRGAIHRVSNGEIYISRGLTARLARRTPVKQTLQVPGPLERLTSRQREILQLLAEGQTTKSIALILKVSPKTIEYHRAQLMDRLAIHDVP